MNRIMHALFIFVLTLAYAPSLFAALNTQPRNVPDIDFGTWAGGSVSDGITACMISHQQQAPRAWRLQVFDRDNTGAYQITDGAGNTANFTVIARDLAGQQETLTPSQYTAFTFAGRPRNCPGGNNFSITVNFNELELGKLQAGTYTLRMQLFAIGGRNGTQTRSKNFDLIITIPDVVRVSQLEDFSFGTWDAVSALARSDALCVYKNGVASYSVSARGSGTASAFSIEDGTATLAGTIDYEVYWTDSGGRAQLFANAPAVAKNGANTTSTTCNNGLNNSATVEVAIPVLNMQGKQANYYDGTLFITIGVN